MKIPSRPISLMRKIYREVFPVVHHELNHWRERAKEIPNKNYALKHWQVSIQKLFIVKEAVSYRF